jgi:hypothetical protein
MWWTITGHALLDTINVLDCKISTKRHMVMCPKNRETMTVTSIVVWAIFVVVFCFKDEEIVT